MDLTDVQREALRGLLMRGMVSVGSVAKVLGISRQAVHRWVDAKAAARARERVEMRIIVTALHPTKPIAVPRMPDREKIMRVVAQQNPNKALVLTLLRRGKINVREAAKKAQVSERSIRAWCKMHHVRLRARQDEPEPVREHESAASIKARWG